jgi:site-specific recombinase XerD
VTDVRLSARKGEVHLVGKGEKSRDVPVHARLREALAAWLAERPSRPGAGLPALFTSGRGTRMTTDALADVITVIVKAAGLDDHVTSHVLRHTFGTELTRSGVDIVTVAQLMGHASLQTTRLYTRPSAADMQRAGSRDTSMDCENFGSGSLASRRVHEVTSARDLGHARPVDKRQGAGLLWATALAWYQ